MTLTIDDLGVTLGNIRAVHGLTTSLSGGQLIGLIGSNGAGKSTLLRCIAGLIRPNCGRMFLDGVPFSPLQVSAARANGVMLVAQELDLFPQLSVSDNWRLLSPSGRIAARGNKWATDHRPARFLEPSEGQQLLLDAMEAGSTRVLLLDEPTALLGLEAAARLIRCLRQKSGTGQIVVIATHRRCDIETMDRWLFMTDGGLTLDTCSMNDALVLYDSQAIERATQASDQGRTLATARQSFTATIKTSAFKPIQISVQPNTILGLKSTSGAPLGPAARALVRSLRVQGLAVAFLAPERFVDHVFSVMTIDEHLQLWLGVRHPPESFVALLRDLGIVWSSTVSNLPLTSLSGGSQQKLLLALTLSVKADIRVICDPNRGVDNAGRQAIVRALTDQKSLEVPVILLANESDFLSTLVDAVVDLQLAEAGGIHCKQVSGHDNSLGTLS